MEKEQTAKQNNFIAGVIFALAAVGMLIFTPMDIEYYEIIGEMSRLIYNFLEFGGLVIIAFALVCRRKNAIITVGFCLLALSSLFDLELYSIASMFSGILKVVAWGGAAVISVLSFKERTSQGKNALRDIWFLPICCLIFGTVLNILAITWYYLIIVVLEVVGLILALLWITHLDGASIKKPDSIFEPDYATVSSRDFMYCGLAKHILLLLFTFGVWHYIWIYRMTGYTNSANDEEERNPTTKLLLCLFVPFYIIYWTYKTAQRIDKMAYEKGLASNMTTLCLILEILIPIVPPILLQDKVNTILTAKDIKVVREKEVLKADNTTLGIADEIKKYKELLDAGIITQDEFDAKKKQLLGL